MAIIGGGVKALKGVLTVTILSGLALSVPELIINKFIGPELSVLASSIIIMTVIVVSAKFMPTNDPDYEIKAEVRGITGGEGVIADAFHFNLCVSAAGFQTGPRDLRPPVVD